MFQTGKGTETYRAHDLSFTKAGLREAVEEVPDVVRTVDPVVPPPRRVPREGVPDDVAARAPDEAAAPSSVRVADEVAEAVPEKRGAVADVEPAPAISKKATPKEVQQHVVSALEDISTKLKARKLPSGMREQLKQQQRKLQKMADDHPGCL